MFINQRFIHFPAAILEFPSGLLHDLLDSMRSLFNACAITCPSSTFLVNADAKILTDRLHTYLDLNSNGSPY